MSKRRATRQRVVIASAVARSQRFRSAQEIHDDLKTSGEQVGLTTVYRTLQAMAEAGEIDVLRSSDGESVYRRCDTEQHHHHLVCVSCGSSVELSSRAVERWAERSAEAHGYKALEHVAEVYGLCARCS